MTDGRAREWHCLLCGQTWAWNDDDTQHALDCFYHPDNLAALETRQ